MKSRIVAALLAACSSVAVAADQTVSFNSLSASFDSVGPLLQDGQDVVTFSGLSAGLYDFTLTLSGQYVDLSSAVLNGVVGAVIDTGRWTFVGIDGQAEPDFVLTLTGIAASARAIYSGEITVSPAPVPEPQTYALMLAGLSALGFVALRRRRAD